MNEECIIRKLIADGDGAGDDRRLVAMLPLLLKYIREPESSQSLLPRILKMLDAAETALKKQVLISAMNERQIEEYASLTKQIGLISDFDLPTGWTFLVGAAVLKFLPVQVGTKEGKLPGTMEQQIVEASEKMSAAKKELVVAKGIRKNKEEYELLAKMIDKVPSRPETNRKLEIIKKELEELHEKQRTLEAKLADRRNHLHAFNIILANFCRFLKDEEDGGDEMMNTTDDENLVSQGSMDMKKEKF